MIRLKTALVTLIVIDIVLAFAAARMPWFPGDPQIARAIQHFAPMPIPLAQVITTSALPHGASRCSRRRSLARGRSADGAPPQSLS